MLTVANLVIHIVEGLAITAVIYLVTKRRMVLSEMALMFASITLTFLVLDLFAPKVAMGARQGSGFGLGYMQVAGDGNTMPRQYYDPSIKRSPVIEGMDDPVAKDYYSQFNGQESSLKVGKEPNFLGQKDQEESETSIIKEEYDKNPFKSTELYAPYPESM